MGKTNSHTKKFFLFSFFLLAIFFALPRPAGAASLYLSPSQGSYTVDNSFKVAVGVNTGGVAINSAQATISFSKDILEITGLSQSGIFTLWPVTPSYSNSSGTVTFAGGLPSPGYNGSAGTIVTITFKAKAVGTATASIGSASVLANDGFGTNVLTSSGKGSYVISKAEEKPVPPPPEEKNLPRAPTISSATHPDQNLWYNNANPAFSWIKEEGVAGFSFVFDDQPATTPDTTTEGNNNSNDYTQTGDGAWYFHARAQNKDGWGPAGHYRVQIDATPPLPFNIDLLDGKRATTAAPRLSFETTDATSGIHHYDLIIDGGTTVSLDVGKTTPYTLPDLSVGEHQVKAVAYDKASNSRAAEASFAIVSPEAKPPVEEVKKEKELAEKIAETIKKALPVPLRKITENLGQTIQKIRQNEGVRNVVNNVVTPLTTTIAVVTATGLATAVATSFNFYNLLYLFFRFGYFWLVPITLGKKRKPWGVIFDSITGKPVVRAVVRIFTREFNKLKEAQITDAQGRFGFMIDPGQYYVTVTVPGYVFPSHILKTASLSQYDDIYRGDTLEVRDAAGGFLSINIPVDPNMREVSTARLKWLKVLNIISFFLDKISTPLLIAGTALSWVALVLEPKLLNYVILSLYALLIVFKYAISKKFGRSVGMVLDKETGKPIEMAIVRIYNASTSTIIATKITNIRGQFNALLAPGKYYLVIVKPGYETFQSKPVSVSRYRGYIRLTAELKPKRAAEPPPGTGRDFAIHLEAEPLVMEKDKPTVKSQEKKTAPPDAVNNAPVKKKNN